MKFKLNFVISLPFLLGLGWKEAFLDGSPTSITMAAEAVAAAAADSTIDVFLRIRPSTNPSSYFERDEIDDNKIRFKVPVDQSTVNNTRTHYGFEFNGVLDEQVNQKDVFQTVGIPITKNVLDGYNSTVSPTYTQFVRSCIESLFKSHSAHPRILLLLRFLRTDKPDQVRRSR